MAKASRDNEKWDFGFAGGEMNINYWWLEYIKDQMGIYMFHYHQIDDGPELHFQGMYRALKMMESLVSPKIESDSVEINLHWLKDNIRLAFVKDCDNRTIGYRPGIVNQIEDKLQDTYDLLLVKMERHGLLSIHQIKAEDAMGNFKSA